MRPNNDDPIVVTGMGAVSPLGVGVETNWTRLLAGQSGIVKNNRFDVTDYSSKVAGLVPSKADDPHGFDANDFIDAKDQKKMDLFIQYSMAATEEALQQSKWVAETEEQKERTSTIIATGVGGFPAMTKATETIRERGPRRLSPFTVPSFLGNMAAGHISIRYGFKGEIGSPITACAASAQAIGDGVRLLRSGAVDVAVCGGSDACVDPVAIGGFGAARALCTKYNDEPGKASRPFDEDHAGFVLSEGAATLVLERESHARARGAKILGTVEGYGTCADAYHLTALAPGGAGGVRAMELAFRDAGMVPDQIDYVNAHSTSTQVGDEAEIEAIHTVFGDRGTSLAVNSTKASVGHLLGAAGAIEAVYSLMALREQTVPPGINIDRPMEAAAQYELAKEGPVKRDIDFVLSNGFGFGGVNATLIFGRA
ncbi:beta-ketoacyl-[acyl-carrier-protein] synthase II [Maritalea myrionectae]|uniref:3-oxoacyl-[acyl-carrier-protein] synthase 2 n=1 Tax=Maritalea myrionectae TaxID=454601 RepID=A0A2R4MDM1_9HYPH|nr:beta-ketoacyl-ACP synthase II [Maritalea myrionectae]AVX04100.1 beta-ketoacyl-[acyl-carrier-protein] synthase II [Maritalea myrionectae]